MRRSIECWRVFYTAPRAEKKCEDNLREQSLEVFLPKLAVVRRWKNGVRKRVEEPLFPNYLFARVSERDRIRVLETAGIVRSVMFDGKLAELSDEEIEQLRITQQNPEEISRILYPIPAVGDHVEVQDGPFQGLRGEVLEHQGQSYIVLSLEAIRQSVRIKVQADLLVRCRAA